MAEGTIYLEDQNTPHKDLALTVAEIGYKKTPLFSRIKKSTPLKKGKAIDGRSWWYKIYATGSDDNAHEEGSTSYNSVKQDFGESLNHYQIVKHGISVSGSVEDLETVEGKAVLLTELENSTDDHGITIERILMSATAPVQRSNVTGAKVAGKMGGIRHWLTVENTVLAGGVDINDDLLTELFEIGWKNGVETQVVYMNTKQKNKLDKLDKDSNHSIYGKTDKKMGNYKVISNSAYATDVVVILTPYLPQDMILAVNEDTVELVYHRLTFLDDLGKTGDSTEKTIISELTLEVESPFAVTAITGLKTT